MTTRRNITQPSDHWEAFARAAKRAGLSLSEWIGEACKAALPVKEAAKLGKRPPVGRTPKEGTD